MFCGKARKTLALVLTLAMVFSLVVTPVYADTTAASDSGTETTTTEISAEAGTESAEVDETQTSDDTGGNGSVGSEESDSAEMDTAETEAEKLAEAAVTALDEDSADSGDENGINAVSEDDTDSDGSESTPEGTALTESNISNYYGSNGLAAGTYYLAEDIDLADVQAYALLIAADVTIDLNGHTLFTSDSVYYTYFGLSSPFSILALECNVTIKDSSSSGTGAVKQDVYIMQGMLTIAGGSYSSTDTSFLTTATYFTDNLGYSSGTISVTGGSFDSALRTSLSSYLATGYSATQSEDGSTYTVTGNTCTLSYSAGAGTGTVPDSQTGTAGQAMTVASGDDLSREGYTFNGWVDEDGNRYAAGDSITIYTDVTLTARWKTKGDVARIDDAEMGTGYSTLAEAFAAANEATSDLTITLLDDVDLEEPLSLAVDASSNSAYVSVTLDLNGHTIAEVSDFESSYDYIIKVTDGELIITDSTEGAGGAIISATAHGIWVTDVDRQYPVLTISGGTVKSTGGYAIYAITNAGSGSSKINIEGGSVKSSSTEGIYLKYAYFTMTGGTVAVETYSSDTMVCAIRDEAACPVAISGGTITATNTSLSSDALGYGIYMNNSAEQHTFTVSGGTIYGSTAGIYCKSAYNLTMTGGTIEGGSYGIRFYGTDVSDRVSISGGYVKGSTYSIITPSFSSSSSSSNTYYITGGYFSSDVTLGLNMVEGYTGYICAYLDSGENSGWYQVMKPADAVLDSSEGAAVSLTINETTTYYANLASALAVIGEDGTGTVRLLQNVGLGTSAVVVCGTTTLDLAGHTITTANSQDNGRTGNIYPGAIYVTGALTLNDSSEDDSGSITNTDGHGIVGASGCDSVTINAGTIRAGGGNYGDANCYGIFMVYSSPGDLIINGGSIISTEGSTGDNASTSAVHTYGNVTITGGTITGKDYGVYCTWNGSSDYTLTISGTPYISGGTRAVYSSVATNAVSGGYYSSDVRDYCSAGYTCVSIMETQGCSYQVVEATSENASVAVISSAGGSTTYHGSLTNAVGAADEGDTVQVLTDIELINSVAISNTVTLDLNGHIVSGSESYGGLLTISGSGVTVTLKDSSGGTGKLENTSSTSSPYAIQISGTAALTVEGGTLNAVATSSGSAYGIYQSGSSTVTMNGGTVSATKSSSYGYAYGIYQYSTGTVTMNGGTVSAASTSGYAYGIYQNSTGTVTMNGGTVSATSEKSYGRGLYMKDTVTVPAESTVVVSGSSSTFQTSGSAYIISIAGGHYSSTVSSSYCAEGYEPYTETTGDYATDGVPYTVKKSDVAAVYDADGNYVSGYDNLSDAYTAAVSGGKIVLLGDVTGNITIKKNLTLDLNGYTLSGTSTSSPTIVVGNGSTYDLTIIDSSEEQTGTVTGWSGNGVIRVVNGTLTIEDGNYIVDSELSTTKIEIIRVNDNSSAKLVINGGTFGTETDTANSYVVRTVGVGTIEISSGTFYAGSFAVKCAVAKATGTVSVTGGCFRTLLSESNSSAIEDGYLEFKVTGGYYTSNSYLSQYLPDGYTATKLTGLSEDDEEYAYNDMWKVRQYDFVIVKDATEEEDSEIVAGATTLKNAVSTVTNSTTYAAGGYTIVMNADSDQKVTINHGVTVTLDLNGHKIDYSSGPAIAVHGSLTINDSSAEQTGAVIAAASQGGVVRNFNGTLIINGGSYSYSDTTASAAVIRSGPCTDSSCDGIGAGDAKLIINGGTFNGIYTVVVPSGIVEMNGGTYTATTAALWTSYSTYNDATYTASATINGGYFNCDTIWKKSGDSILSVTGGYFKADPSGYVADNYEVAVNDEAETYTYFVADIIYGKTITLDGTTNLEIYVYADYELESATIDIYELTDLSEYVETVGEGEDAKDCYVFTEEVMPYKMSDSCAIVLNMSNGYTVETSTSVRECAEALLAVYDSDSTEYGILVVLLNYGAKMQLYMNYNTDNLANSVCADTSDAISAVSIDSKYKSSIVSNTGDLTTLSTFELQCNAGFTLKLKFSKSISGYTVSVTGVSSYSISDDGLYIYVDLSAVQLGDTITVSITDDSSNSYSFTTSGLAYARVALNNSSNSAEKKTLMQAIYLYNAAFIAEEG